MDAAPVFFVCCAEVPDGVLFGALIFFLLPEKQTANIVGCSLPDVGMM